MRKIAFYCDHCGGFIEDKINMVFAKEVDEKEIIKDNQPLDLDMSNIHLCGACTRALVESIKTGMKPKDDSDTKPVKRGRPKKDDSKKKEQVEIAMEKYKKMTGK